MPYFSQAQLVSQFAYSEQLRYTYYLRQGRPSFAFITFLTEELKNGAQTVSNKRYGIFYLSRRPFQEVIFCGIILLIMNMICI